MELSTFAALTDTTQFETLAKLDMAAINDLRMAAERAEDKARATRNLTVAATMSVIVTRANSENLRRFRSSRPAKRDTGCVAKVNGSWVRW